MSPPEVGRQHMAGNFALLECNGVQVLIGHMQRGSVRVQISNVVLDAKNCTAARGVNRVRKDAIRAGLARSESR